MTPNESGDRQWFYLFNGESQGPLSDEAIVHLVASKALPPSTLIWTDGFSEWTEADKVDWNHPRDLLIETRANESVLTGRKGYLGWGLAVAISTTIGLFSLFLHNSR